MKKVLFAYIALMGLGLCYNFQNVAYAQKKQKNNASKNTVAENKNTVTDERAVKLLFDGMTAKIKGNIDGAAEIYKQCLSIDPNNDAAMYELAKIYFGMSNREEALAYSANAVQVDPDNKWYQLLYAEVLAINDKYDQAATIYQRLLQKYPNNYDYYFDLSYMYMRAGNIDKAIQVYDELESKVGVMEELSIQKQKLYIRQGKVDKAIVELQKLIAADSANPYYYQMLAELYEANNRPEDALATYQKMMEVDPENPFARLAMALYYKGRGETDKYFENMKYAFGSSIVPINIKGREIEAYIRPLEDDKSRTVATELIAEMVKAHPNDPIAHTLQGDFFYAQKQKAEALQAYKKATQVKGDAAKAWNQVLWLELELDKYEDLSNDSQEMIELFPNDPIPYFYNGLANIRQQKNDKAIKVLKRGATISGTQTRVGAQINSLLGEAYNNQKDYENSDKYFDKAIQLDPNDANTLNNYSYYLSLRGAKLDDAVRMAQKANELQPNTSSYLDTHGWILYRQGKYDEARRLIEKALLVGGDQSGTILEHYGDILFKLGDSNEALKHWEKAKQKGEASPDIDKKIKERKTLD